MAEDYLMPKGELMKGKRGVVTGVANHQSIAWGIASQLAAQGAEMAFLHLPGMERRVEPLAQSAGVKVLAPVDVTDDASMEAFMVREASWSISSGRVGTPADVGRLIAFLASPANDYLNGTNLRIDGGVA